MSKKILVDKVLNVSGLLPPQSNFLIIKTLEKIDRGRTVEIVSHEKQPIHIIPEICSKGQYKIIETREAHGLVHCKITKI